MVLQAAIGAPFGEQSTWTNAKHNAASKINLIENMMLFIHLNFRKKCALNCRLKWEQPSHVSFQSATELSFPICR